MNSSGVDARAKRAQASSVQACVEHLVSGFVEDMLDREPEVDGIVSINEMSLPGLVPALERHGRRRPRDVSVCAVAMTPLGLERPIKLTTVENPSRPWPNAPAVRIGG